MVKDRYLNFFTDFGFKKLFGQEVNKNLLKDFLNQLLSPKEGTIVELQFLQNEHLAAGEQDRKAIFDLYCITENNNRFIVELQKSKQKFFKDRALYYATFPIQEQVKRGEWNYQLDPVYLVAILDFVFDEDSEDPEKYRYDVKLMDEETNAVFYDKLTFTYLAMPKFRKEVDELENEFEKWLYAIKHLHTLSEIPSALQENVFEQLFKEAEIAKLAPMERRSYEASLKYYRDLQNSFDTAREEGETKGWQGGKQVGLKQGRKEGEAIGMQKGETKKAREIAAELIDVIDDTLIAQKTGLSIEEIKKLRTRKKQL